MPKCIMLSGIPCSGKSTWARQQGLPILSCDDIRLELNGGDYKFDHNKEEKVWNAFYNRVSKMKGDFIVDNTNCKAFYFKRIVDYLSTDYTVEVKLFPISLRKAYIRNIIRYLKTGKRIPFKVLKHMQRNFKNLHR